MKLFMSYQRFKKRWSGSKKSVFGKKCAKIARGAFLKSLITQKQSFFEHSYVSYGKRQKSCTLIII